MKTVEQLKGFCNSKFSVEVYFWFWKNSQVLALCGFYLKGRLV